MTAKKVTPASKLIAERQAKPTGVTLSKEAADDVWSILQYNDSVGWKSKVARHDVVKMLREDHGMNISMPTFDRLVKATFGRTFGV